MRRLLLVLALLLLVAVPEVAQGNGDGNGDDFLLGGVATHAQDPENSANDVIKIDTTSPDQCNPILVQDCNFGTVSRKLNVKIDKLDNMLELKAYFQNRSCGGGSPRIQLAVDLDGDGQSNGNAFGYYEAPGFTFSCPPNNWEFRDLTDAIPRWDIAQLTGVGEIPGPQPYVIPWSTFEALVSQFPNHLVCTGAMIDDSGWLPGAEGVAFYDIISIGNATWEDHDDTAGRGFARGCGPIDDDDGDDDDDDHDRDGDHDDEDDSFNDRRQNGDDDD